MHTRESALSFSILDCHAGLDKKITRWLDRITTVSSSEVRRPWRVDSPPAAAQINDEKALQWQLHNVKCCLMCVNEAPLYACGIAHWSSGVYRLKDAEPAWFIR